jgi:hypothetical protein
MEAECAGVQALEINSAIRYHACWIPKAMNTHSECVILKAFKPQQWLHERDSVLSYTYVACIVNEKTADIRHMQLLGRGLGAEWYGPLGRQNEYLKLKKKRFSALD